MARVGIDRVEMHLNRNPTDSPDSGAGLKPLHSTSAVSTVTLASVVEHPRIAFVRETYTWLVPLMITVLLVAIVGNSLIVISSPWLSPPITPYLRLCISLAAADMWAASLLTAGLVINSYLSMVLRIRKSSDRFAAVLEVFRIGGMLTSDLHLFALAINQFVGIAWPLKYKVLMTTKRIRIAVLVLWLAPVFFILSWFLAFENDGLRHPKCRHQFYLRLPFRLTVFIMFMTPLLATLSIYAIILFTLLKAKIGPTFFLCSHRSSKTTPGRFSQAASKTRGTRTQLRGKIKLVWTTLIIVSTFSLSWGLCVLYFVLVCRQGCTFIYGQSVNFYVGFFINSTVNGLVMLKLLINPFIYALRLAHIRASVARFLRFALGRSSSKANSPTVLNSQHTSSAVDAAAALIQGCSKNRHQGLDARASSSASHLADGAICLKNALPTRLHINTLTPFSRDIEVL
uniref:G-protein coupled receptors family 1 profile domain-containing protein n=1 Tax=Ascaris lumbricoides TaxID=6252 RepID=A0A9J2P5V0_ASCLU